jgi:hypothetical protein
MNTELDLDPSFFDFLEDPSSTQNLLDLLHDQDQAHRKGLLEREEFQARKKHLLARIRGRS